MESDIDRTIRVWAVSEVMPWRMRGGMDNSISAEAVQLNPKKSAFRFCIHNGRVSVSEGPREARNIHRQRCQAYLGFFEEVLGAHPTIPDTTFILDVADRPISNTNVPTFQFQKPAGSESILLPDIDFLNWDYYEQPSVADTIPYAEKAISAIFVGSTSGQNNTVETVRSPVAPRLRAAKHFRGHADIHFFLPNLCTCENAEAERSLRDLGFGGPTISWSTQFAHRFVISIDGNGATCSRVAVALKSNSVLLKYDSPHTLFYFRGLQPWVHYIPVSADSDIENFIAIEREAPGAFATIAASGRRFAESYTSKPRVLQFAGELLAAYAAIASRE
jgi:Glycosyl transferase family 90